MKSTTKTKGSKLVSSKSEPLFDGPQTKPTNAGMTLVGPGLTTPATPKDYKKEGAT